MFNKLSKKWMLLICICSISVFLFLFYKSAWDLRQERTKNFEIAYNKLEEKQYQEALDLFLPLANFQDTQKYIDYLNAIFLHESGEYEKAAEEFKKLGDFLDSVKYSQIAENKRL